MHDFYPQLPPKHRGDGIQKTDVCLLSVADWLRVAALQDSIIEGNKGPGVDVSSMSKVALHTCVIEVFPGVP